MSCVLLGINLSPIVFVGGYAPLIFIHKIKDVKAGTGSYELYIVRVETCPLVFLGQSPFPY
jgi:hypothetical protein